MLAVFLSFVLYTLYVLLPLVPATVIYKNFPNTKVAVSGPLSKFSVRASGAFAAYIVTVLLGFFIVAETQVLIRAIPHTSWTVVSEIELYDAEGNRLGGAQRDQLLQYLDITIDPSRDNPVEDKVYVKTPIYNNNPPTIIYEIPEFGQDKKRLNIESVEFNRLSHKVVHSEPIEIRQKREQAWRDASEASIRASN